MRLLMTCAAMLVFALAVPTARAGATEQLFVRMTADPTRLYNGWNGALPPGADFAWRTLTIESQTGDSVENMKTRVQDQLGLPPEQIFLSFEGRLLGDRETRESAGIAKESTLALLLPVGSPSTVPEPESWALMGLSLLLVGWRMRWRRAVVMAAA